MIQAMRTPKAAQRAFAVQEPSEKVITGLAKLA